MESNPSSRKESPQWDRTACISAVGNVPKTQFDGEEQEANGAPIETIEIRFFTDFSNAATGDQLYGAPPPNAPPQ